MTRLVSIFTFFSILIFSAADSVSAEYYVSDYDPDYVPYNLREVIDSSDYDSCRDELRSFDASYNEYLSLYGTPVSVGDTLDVNFGALMEMYEEEFRQCLIALRKEVQENAVDACDFDAIESLSADDARTYRSEINECENERAIDVCDFDYIDNMEGSDKFKYRNEIDVCEASLEPEVIEPKPEPVVISEPQIPAVVTPVPELPAPVYRPTPVLAQQPASDEEEVVEVANDQTSISSASTTTEPETFEMTQDEIDALIAEKLAESQQETFIPDEEPGFFKRVWNFLTSWF